MSSQNPSTGELEVSLNRGEEVVRSQYNRDFRRFGSSFATGDRKSGLNSTSKAVNAHHSAEIARDALKDVIIHLQSQVISNLKIQWQQDTVVDFNALQDVSDLSQDRAIVVLMQLQQRIITSAPIAELRPPPLFSSSNPPNNPTPEHRATVPPPFSPSDISNTRQLSTTDNTAVKKRHFTSVAKIPFLRRPKADHVTKNFSDSSVGSTFLLPRVTTQTDQRDQQDYANRKNSTFGQDITNRQHLATEDDLSPRSQSISTSSSGAFEPETPDFNPWAIQRSPSPSQRSQVSFASSSQRRDLSSTLEVVTSNVSISHKDLLPCEANKFAGFCKGAWRLQIGDRKKAMEERQRPGGMFNANRYWQCSRCKFEGRMVIDDTKSKGFDKRIFSTEGIQFRWEFLFKSHVESKEDTRNPLRANFACIFCCADGKGTPTFGGIDSLLNHLQEHRDPLPSGEVLYRMNCLVGRNAGPKDNFDINLIGKMSEL